MCSNNFGEAFGSPLVVRLMLVFTCSEDSLSTVELHTCYRGGEMQKVSNAQLERRKKKRVKNKPVRQKHKHWFKQVIKDYNATTVS